MISTLSSVGMAVDFREREQLLSSSEFLNDDGILSENRTVITHIGSSTESISNGFGLSGSSSGLSSPFGSELSSTETESNEDNDHDFIAELIRQMADYTLEEDDENAARNCGPENLKYSTGLPPFSGSDCNLGSTETLHGHASDDQTPAVQLYKLENQPTTKNQGSICWDRRRVKKTEVTQQKQQFQHQKPHHKQNRGGRADALSAGGFGSPATACPPLQQRRQQNQQVGSGSGSGSGSGMRAVFLGGPGSRSGSCGTGVFLPRGTDNPSEVRKKAGCATVLIPARVMQALQLHFQGMNARSKSNSHPLQHDVATARRSDLHHPQQKRPARSRKLPAAKDHDMGLPHEWTY